MNSDSHVEWCRNIFRMLAEGGTWGVPRSGLIFQRQGTALVLTEKLPWVDGMPMTAAELTEYQDDDFKTIKEHFAAAGVTVREPPTPTPERA